MVNFTVMELAIIQPTGRSRTVWYGFHTKKEAEDWFYEFESKVTGANPKIDCVVTFREVELLENL